MKSGATANALPTSPNEQAIMAVFLISEFTVFPLLNLLNSVWAQLSDDARAALGGGDAARPDGTSARLCA
jgi:hypothetical protein